MLNHEIFISSNVSKILNQSNVQIESDALKIADRICNIKGWNQGLCCLVVARKSNQQKNTDTVWFHINEVLDFQTSSNSCEDLNKNTPPLNKHPHCLLTRSKKGPNRYRSFSDLKRHLLKGDLQDYVK